MPDPTNLLDYNRFMMVRGNPLKFRDPDGHSSVVFDGGETPLPEWWLKGVKRVNVEGYGVFDRSHIQRGYEYAGRFMNEVHDALSEGSPIIGSHRSHYAFYSVSDDITPKQIDGIALGIYTHFDYGYEQWQAENGIHAWSAFSVEDLPSDLLGAWLYINGYELDYAARVLERMGTVTEGASHSLVVNTINTAYGAVITGFPRNYEFSPMAPQTDRGFIYSQTKWENVAWPEWFEYEIIESSPSTWQWIGP